MDSRKKSAGFTLVELAIVMIIVGLLVGGVLKGQELITNARVTAAVKQVKGAEAAVLTFRDMYRALPGDMVDANMRIPHPPGVPQGNGNGNYQLDNGPGFPPDEEGPFFFTHLWLAGLTTDINPIQGEAAWGGMYPDAKIGSCGLHPGWSLGRNADFANAVPDNAPMMGLHLTFTRTPRAVLESCMTSNHAARIDTKLDDGGPITGSVRSYFTEGGCHEGSGGIYMESDTGEDCGLFVKIQN